MSPKAAPDYPGILGAARRIAQAESVQKAERVLAEKCWTEGCTEPRSDERNGYWCTRHHDERRERITRGMAQIANDSYGIPRNHGGTGKPFVAHDIEVRSSWNPNPTLHPVNDSNGDRWWWKCTCGSESEQYARTRGIAAAAGKRHQAAIRKAEAKA